MTEEQTFRYPIYDRFSGRCWVCRAETLWGEAPHNEGCEVAKLLLEVQQLRDSRTTVATKLSTSGNRSFHT